jgi:hypothetical protein
VDRARVAGRWGWRDTAVLLACLTALTIVRLVLAESLADQGYFTKYTHYAQELLAGESVADRAGDLSPGYLAAVVALMGPFGLDWHGVRTVQIVATSLAALACALAAGLRWGRVASAATAAVLLGSRGVLVNALELEPETLVLVLNAVGFAALVACPRWIGPAAAGMAFGMSAVTRPTALLVLAAVAGGVLWDDVRAKVDGGTPAARRWGGAALLVACGLVVVVGARLAGPSGVTLMNPGTVLYEGMNPAATGYQGEAPEVVKAVEATVGEPDALHVGYRVVAERALDADRGRERANRYWLRRAVAFVELEPVAAVSLWLHKLWFSVASYEAWDLETAVAKDWELERWPWIPFGLVAAVGVAALVVGGRERLAAPLAFGGLATVAVMVTFYVTSRQRNAMLPAVALLAGLAAHRWVEQWMSGHRRHAVSIAMAVVLVGTALSVDAHPQAEDRHQWELVVTRRRALRAAETARAQGRDEASERHLRHAALALDANALLRTGPDELDAVVSRRLHGAIDLAQRFDAARMLMLVGRWAHADAVLAPLQEAGYQPRRGPTVVSSVAYQRARCAARLGRPLDNLLAKAHVEAPGDAHVLALALVHAGDAEHGARRRRLARLHDRFTVLAALARAADDLGDTEQARVWRQQISAELPMGGHGWWR